MSAKAARILGVNTTTVGDTAAIKPANALDIDFSDVALAPDEGPPPIPLRSGGEPAMAGIPAMPSVSPHTFLPSQLHRPSHQELGFNPDDFNGGAQHHRSKTDDGQMVMDTPSNKQVKHKHDISPFLFQEKSFQRDNTPHRPSEQLSQRPSLNDLTYVDGATVSTATGGSTRSFSERPSVGTVVPGRPTTPPLQSASLQPAHTLAHSSSQISLGNGSGSTTPSHGRRSKNPLKFFKKKSVSVLREGEESPSSTPRISGSGVAGTGAFASGAGGGGSGAASFLHSSTFGGRPDSRDNTSSLGLDEELLGMDEQDSFSAANASSVGRDSRKTKLIGRPRTRDKDSKKARTLGSGSPAVGSSGGAGGVPVGVDAEFNELGLGLTSHRPSQAIIPPRPVSAGTAGATNGGTDVKLALDTNFDQIDDFVNTSVRQSSLVGPMDEVLTPQEGQSTPLRKLSIPVSPTTQRPGRDRSTSVSFVEQVKPSSAASSSLDSPQRPHAPRRLNTASGSTLFQHNRTTPQQTRDVVNDPRLSKMTKAEVQAMIASRAQSVASTSQSSLGERTPPPPRESSVSYFDRRPSGLSESHTLAPVGHSDDFREDRKASYASTASRMTNGSDISPTTSVNNVSKVASSQGRPKLSDRRPSGQGGGVNQAYTFPPDSRGANPADPRKSSASSGKVTSSWMAPDSWAVQEDEIRDALRDEDEETTDDAISPRIDPLTASPSYKRDIGRPSLAGSLWATASATSGPSHLPSVSSSSESGGQHTSIGGASAREMGLQSRRETMDSSVSTGSATMDRDASMLKSYDSTTIEVLNSASTPRESLQFSSSSPPQPQPAMPPLTATISSSSTATSMTTAAANVRPSSRGGSTIGHAAAAAAGRLGFHRPTRIKISNSNNNRPSTATSVTSGWSGFTAQNRGLPPTPQGEEDWSTTWKSTSGKRSGVPVKHNYMRIYKDDGTHSVLSVSLEATTAELRNQLLRKAVEPTTSAKTLRLFVLDKGSERPLNESEKPAMLQRRRMEQAGYTESDSLEDLGREDMRFLLKFVYRGDHVTNFDSYSFGNTEADFNVLDLRKRNLEMVPIFLYRHAEWIKSLDVSGNPMHDIPLDFIQLCTSLSTLCLSHLSLKRVPQSIRHAVRLTHLDVSDNRIPDLGHINLSEIPQLMSLKAQNNRLSELPPYFAEMQFLRDLNVSNNRYGVFPLVVCQLSNLRQLDISFNTIAELPEQLGDLEQLQRLVLVGNSIVDLPASISKIFTLQTIDVRRNLLQNVDVLFDLPRLEELKCEHNSIKHLDVTFRARLKTIEIGRNPLSKATFRAQDMCSLTVLNVSSANMGKLDDNVLSQLPNLTELVLDHNNLVVLPDNLGELSQLTRLSCSNNILATLPESIGVLAKLNELLVHNNNLKTLPSGIWHCESLHHINVSSNLLESFPEPSEAGPNAQHYAAESVINSGILQPPESRKASSGSLGPLPKVGGRDVLPLSYSLKKLRMGDNRLSEDVFSIFNSLPELQILNLTNNELYELPMYGLSNLVKLRELYLSGNSLGSLPADVLPLLKELRILHVNGNKLQTLPAELGRMENLVKLDVGNNTLKYNISNQQYDWNWNSNPHLRYLNLSGNKRLEIKSSLTNGPNGHDAHGKAVTSSQRTDSSDFQRLTSLRLLGLMDVTVTLTEMPSDSSDRRVRTSLSQINQMAYGISDALGQHDHLNIVDEVVQSFRKRDNECLFGLFAGRGHGEKDGSKLAYQLSNDLSFRVLQELQNSTAPKGSTLPPAVDAVENAMRRAFLQVEKDYASYLLAEGDASARSEERMGKSGGKGGSGNNNNSKTDTVPTSRDSDKVYSTIPWRSGASAVLVYVTDKTMFVANCGDALAVLSRNSTAHLVSTKHEPFDRNETLRIRSAEGWVSLTGHVNDTLNVSRGFGYYHLTPIVNAAPAVARIELADQDEFVILANSTLWEVMSYQTAVDIARMERGDPMLAAQKLRDYAISYGAEDGIMVMVVAVSDLFEKEHGGRGGSTAQAGGNASVVGGTAGQLADATTEPTFDFKKGTRRGREVLPGDRTLARLQREVPPPVGKVALVFTDIRNSTSLWETNGGMQSAMRQHNFLLRRQLRNIGGYEVKTEGDAFMVSFQTVPSALLWCFQVQLQLLKENWPQEILESEDGRPIYDEKTGELLYRGLSVRMGVHYGDPVCEADPITRRMDYFGPMVNRAARIEGAAQGGQIMASNDVVTELRKLMKMFDEEMRRTKLEEELRKKVTDAASSPPSALQQDDAVSLLSGTAAEEEEDADQLGMSRDAILLGRMGFALCDMGEHRLKGLETPEMLTIVLPKILRGRLTKSIGAGSLTVTAASASAAAPAIETVAGTAALATINGNDGAAVSASVEVFEPTVHLLNLDEVKMVSYLCLRLEALAQGSLFNGIAELIQSDASAATTAAAATATAAAADQSSLSRTVSMNSTSDAGTAIAGDRTSRDGVRFLGDIGPVVSEAATDAAPVLLPLSSTRQMTVENHLNHHPELALAGMRDDATDEELYTVLHALTGRIWIALSTLGMRRFVARHAGGADNLGMGLDLVHVFDILQAFGGGGQEQLYCTL